MTLTKTHEKDSEAVSQRCFYRKLLNYATIYAEYCIFFEQLLIRTPGIAFEDTNTSKFQRIFSDLKIAFEAICFEMKMTSGYYYVLFLRVIIVSGFRSFEIYKNLWPSLVYYLVYSQQPRR